MRLHRVSTVGQIEFSLQWAPLQDLDSNDQAVVLPEGAFARSASVPW